MRAAVQSAAPSTAVVLQGSVVEWGQAEWAIGDGVCDVVEMTWAQIADPNLVAHLRAGTPERIRPCIRCNQTCQVRDARNPIVTCVAEPTVGHETEDEDWYTSTGTAKAVTVVGGGVAGSETARVAAHRGHHVRIIEARDRLGGVTAVAGPGNPLVEWLVAECDRLGVTTELGRTVDDAHHAGIDEIVVQTTGARPGHREYDIADDAVRPGRACRAPW